MVHQMSTLLDISRLSCNNLLQLICMLPHIEKFICKKWLQTVHTQSVFQNTVYYHVQRALGKGHCVAVIYKLAVNVIVTLECCLSCTNQSWCISRNSFFQQLWNFFFSVFFSVYLSGTRHRYGSDWLMESMNYMKLVVLLHLIVLVNSHQR